MVDKAKERCKGKSNIELIDMDVLDLEMNGCFDVAICSSCLQFMSDPESALGNVYRAVKPSGSVLVTLPHKKRVPDLIRQVTTAHDLRTLTTRVVVLCAWGVRGLSFWNQHELFKKLREVGFRGVAVEAESDWGFLVSAKR